MNVVPDPVDVYIVETRDCGRVRWHVRLRNADGMVKQLYASREECEEALEAWVEFKGLSDHGTPTLH
jgi:hypothetical protein